MSDWLECTRPEGCCFHESDRRSYLADPPSYEWTETCCNCGQRWLVTSRAVPELGHGPHATAPLYYQEQRVPLP